MPLAHRLLTFLRYGCAIGLVVSLASVSLMAQTPSLGNGAPGASQTQAGIYEQPPYGLQAGSVPPAAGYATATSPDNQPWPGSPGVRLAQNPAEPEVIRPGAPAGQGAPPSGAAASGAQSRSESPVQTQSPASPFDTLGLGFSEPALSAGLYLPQPTPEKQREYAQFFDRIIDAENTLYIVQGRDTKLLFHEVPRRVYIQDPKIASVNILTAEQIMVAGLGVGTTALQLWFRDQHDPANPEKDHVLSYVVVVTPNYLSKRLELQQDAAAVEMKRKAYQQALKTLEGQIKELFPDSAVILSLVGNQLVVRGEVKDVVDAAQILSIVARASAHPWVVLVI
jgi:hypothetical protein